jgi:hypothetical protein
MQLPTFDDLLELIDGDRTIPLKTRRRYLTTLREAACYDLGTVLEALPMQTVAELVVDRTDSKGEVSVQVVGPWIIRLLFTPRPGLAGSLFICVGMTNTPIGFFYCWSLRSGGQWFPAGDFPTLDLLSLTAMGLCVIDDAETNHSENVEYIEREETRRVGNARRARRAEQTVRVISLSRTRKQYRGGSGPHQGGSHASPVEHVRIITDRLVTMKNGTQYRRRPRVVVVNKGVTRPTRVVQ